MNSNINLLVDKKNQRLGKTGTLRIFRLSAIGLLFIVSALSITLFILISLSPLPNLKVQERLATTTLSQYRTDRAKLFLIKERTDVAAMIIAKRRSYDRSLDVIQSVLPNGVEVEALIMEKNTLSLTVSSNSLEMLNTFVSNLTGVVNENKTFSQISLGNLSIEAEKNRYLVTLTLVLL